LHQTDKGIFEIITIITSFIQLQSSTSSFRLRYQPRPPTPRGAVPQPCWISTTLAWPPVIPWTSSAHSHPISSTASPSSAFRSATITKISISSSPKTPNTENSIPRRRTSRAARECGTGGRSVGGIKNTSLNKLKIPPRQFHVDHHDVGRGEGAAGWAMAAPSTTRSWPAIPNLPSSPTEARGQGSPCARGSRTPPPWTRRWG